MDILGAGACAGESIWGPEDESRARETRPRGRVREGSPRPYLGVQPRPVVSTTVPSVDPLRPSLISRIGGARRVPVPRLLPMGPRR